MTTLTLVAPPAPSLAEEINREHDQAQQAWRRTAQHAIRCGELLHQAKLDLDHGTWTDWLEQNFAGSGRTARQYMQLAEAHRTRPELVDQLGQESITQAVRLVAQPKARTEPEPAAPTDPTYSLTVPQLVDLVRSFGGDTSPDRVHGWLGRLSEPKATLCPDCSAPIIQTIVKGQTVRAEPESLLEHGPCPKCLQTRHAHPGSFVHCPYCGDTGFTGDHRPREMLLAIDVAWDDDDRMHMRLIGPNTDRRRGEALHRLHACSGEAAA